MHVKINQNSIVGELLREEMEFSGQFGENPKLTTPLQFLHIGVE
jgi:hypothetical protein